MIVPKPTDNMTSIFKELYKDQIIEMLFSNETEKINKYSLNYLKKILGYK